MPSPTKRKIAVAIVHGMGKATPDFADTFQRNIIRSFSQTLYPDVDHPEKEIVILPVYWAPVLDKLENKLGKRTIDKKPVHYRNLREFMISFAGDAIAYEPAPGEKQTYTAIHAVFAKTLRELAQKAGADAPLCIIGHSLGSIIGSNYMYDLQAEARRKRIIPQKVKKFIRKTPIELGETLTLFYTLGSPIALWSLRHRNFGMPITVPSPYLNIYHPNMEGHWSNIYDNDDVIGYPLKDINKKYHHTVYDDIQINVGGMFTSWNPLSHMRYFENKTVAKLIGKSLAQLWKQMI